MKDYRRVLATTDFSETSQAAAQRAASIADRSQAELILLHIVEHFPTDLPMRVTGPGSGPDKVVLDRASEQMDRLAAAIGQPDARKKILVSARSAKQEILRFAEREKVDLIVLAPHGHGFLGMLGSTAAGVMNSAACDVLTVRSGE